MSIPIDINKTGVHHLEILDEVVVPPAPGDLYRLVYIKEQYPWSSEDLDLSIRANIPTGMSKGPRRYVATIGEYANRTRDASSVGFYSWAEGDMGNHHLYDVYTVLSNGRYGPLGHRLSSFVDGEVYVHNGKIGYVNGLNRVENSLGDFPASLITENLKVEIYLLSNALWTFKGLHAYTDTNPTLDVYPAKMNERYGVAEYIAGKFNKFYPFVTK